MPKSLYILAYVLLGLVLFFGSMTMIVQGVSSVFVLACLFAIPYYRYLGGMWKRSNLGKATQRKLAKLTSQRQPPPSYS